MPARFQPVSRASSNTDLVQDLVEDEALGSTAVIAAFLTVDRGLFAPSNGNSDTETPSAACGIYHDLPESLGHGVSLAAPRWQAIAAELLFRSGENQPRSFPSAGECNHGLAGKRVLDVNSGTGYFSVLMGQLVGPSGKVIGIEQVPELVDAANGIVKRHFHDLIGVVNFIDDVRDVSNNELFDVIHVGAAVAHVPQQLVKLLRPYGRMVVPIGVEGEQHFYTVDKLPDGTCKVSKETAVAIPSLESRECHSG